MFNFKKGKGDYGWLVVIVVAVAFLAPQSPLFLGSLFDFGVEKEYSWQGLSWKWQSKDLTNVQVSPLNFEQQGNTLVMSMSCSAPSSCEGYFRNSFLLSNYSEVIFSVVANTAANVGSNSNSGNGVLDLTINGKSITSVGSSAREGGGTQIFSDSDRIDKTIKLLRRTDGGWTVYRDGINISSVDNVNPEVRFNFYANGAQTPSGGSVNVELLINTKTTGQATTQLLCEATGGTYYEQISSCACPSNSKGFKANVGCSYECSVGEVKLLDGSCKELTRTCIDLNQDGLCSENEPIVYQDPITQQPICSDRDLNGICDNVASLFCVDANSNNLCDNDEIRWLSTYCKDSNSNGLCDSQEASNVVCPATYSPVCWNERNLSFPNSCFAAALGAITTSSGVCNNPPVIIQLDCKNSQNPIPEGYTCDQLTGYLFMNTTYEKIINTVTYLTVNQSVPYYVYINQTQYVNQTIYEQIGSTIIGTNKVSPTAWVVLGILIFGIVVLQLRKN